MKYLITILLLISPHLVLAQTKGKVDIVDTATFTVTPSEPVPVPYKVNDLKSEIANLQARDDTWTQRIADDQETISKDQDILKQASDAGVQDAVAVPDQLNVEADVITIK